MYGPIHNSIALPYNDDLRRTFLALSLLTSSDEDIGARYRESAADIRIFAALVIELDRLSIPVVLSANIAHALFSGHVNIKPNLFARTFPSESAICISAMRHLRRYPFAPEITLRLGNFLETLELAKLNVISLLGIGAAENAATTDPLLPLVAAWLRTCRTLFDTTECLDSHIRHIIGSKSHIPSCGRAELLRSVLRGDFSCIDANGTLTLPAWAEQRRSPRVEVSKAVREWRNEGWSDARLRDISAFGLGLSDIGGCSLGDGLVVQLARDRSLQGNVVWVNGTSVGMKLSGCLSINDPVLEATFESAN